MSEEKVLELVITAGATLLAAFLGAGAAVWFAHRVDRAKQTAALAHSCNVALVTLRGRAGLINAIKSGVLEKFRSNPARHLVLHAAVVPWKTAEKVDLASLAFLLGTSDMALFDEFYRLDEVSEVFHTALTLRTAAYVASLDPVLNELGMTGVGLSSEQVELVRSKLAPVTDAKLMHLTNQLYSYADQASDALQAAGPALGLRLMAIFPRQKFLRFSHLQTFPKREPRRSLVGRLFDALRG